MPTALPPNVPQYANTRFGGRDLFTRWLEDTTKYVITFAERGGTVGKWWLDRRGEILHTKIPNASVNGLIVNVPLLLRTNKIAFLNSASDEWYPDTAATIETRLIV